MIAFLRVRLRLGVGVSCRVRFCIRISFTVRVTVRIIQVAIICNCEATQTCGSFRVRSTNGLRVTPPILMKFGTLADNA